MGSLVSSRMIQSFGVPLGLIHHHRLQEYRESQGYREYRESQGYRGYREYRESQGYREYRESQEYREHQGYQELQYHRLQFLSHHRRSQSRSEAMIKIARRVQFLS